MNFPSDVARTLAQMLEARLPGRAAEVAQDARVAPPLSQGVEAWMEVLLIADRAGALRLAGTLSAVAPGDAEVAVVCRELDGSRERLRRAALGVAVVGFGIAAGMLLFPGDASRRPEVAPSGEGSVAEAPAAAPAAPAIAGTRVPDVPVAGSSAPATASVPTGTASLTATAGSGAVATPVYGPSVPAGPVTGPVAPSPVSAGPTVAAPASAAMAAGGAVPAVYGPPLPPGWVPTPVPVAAPAWPAAAYVPMAPVAPVPAAPAPAASVPVAPVVAPAPVSTPPPAPAAP